ncbi:MAG: hypothetical protein CVU05_11625 [Bacteroidetes bacterium HGW-Bacteroidetes-21]|nr:MAG: hypothetical protein CVU05_11625 [Bacteroidetes bacterium HGW-Bacteroidetes-21]
MKTIILIIGLLMTGIILKASEPEVIFPDNVKKHISSINVYPEQAFKYNIEGYVDVVFKVTEKGLLKVEEYFGTDQTLSDYVLESLSDVRMCPYDLSVGKKYKVRYSFNLL